MRTDPGIKEVGVEMALLCTAVCWEQTKQPWEVNHQDYVALRTDFTNPDRCLMVLSLLLTLASCTAVIVPVKSP